MTSTPARIALVGAGPRGTSLLQHLVTAASPGRPLELHVVDPFPFGSGRVWRAEQPALWHTDAGDDVSVLPGGPTLRAWADEVRAERPGADRGPLAPAAGDAVSRRRLGQYLTWAFWRAVRLAPASTSVRTHRARAVDLTGQPHGPQRLVLDTGTEITADVVLLAQGLPGSVPTAAQRARADFADRHGLRYLRPRGGDAVALDDVPAGVDVFVRDAGPVTGDLVALLTRGRGGRYVGGEYRRTGLEPRIHLLPAEDPGLPDGVRAGAAAVWVEHREALARAGVLCRHRTSDALRLDGSRGAFTLREGSGAVAARTLLEPDAGTGRPRAADDPLLRALADRGELAGWSGTGALLDRTGRPHPRRFAFGAITGGADTLTGPGLVAESGAAARTVLGLLAGLPPVPHPAPARDLSRIEVRRVPLRHPDVVPMFAELTEEYAGRYGHRDDLFDLPDGEFEPPRGALLVLREDGRPVAGGAVRRYDAETAELKRIWTHTDHRRRGLARRVVAELEREAARLGYRRIHLTTGARQPEARALYLAAGYEPRFDTSIDPELVGPLAFAKELPPAPTDLPSKPSIPTCQVDIDGNRVRPVRSRP